MVKGSFGWRTYGRNLVHARADTFCLPRVGRTERLSKSEPYCVQGLERRRSSASGDVERIYVNENCTFWISASEVVAETCRPSALK